MFIDNQYIHFKAIQCEVLLDGTVVAECANPAVSNTLLQEIARWKKQGICMEDIVDRLRPRTVPAGYSFLPWKPGIIIPVPIILFYSVVIGTKEDIMDKRRSILAQLEFTYRIHEWEAKGIHFRSYLYVPENHPLTQKPFYEREDEAHLLKVPWNYFMQ